MGKYVRGVASLWFLLCAGLSFADPSAADLALVDKYKDVVFSAGTAAPDQVDGDWKGYRLPDSTFLWVNKDGYKEAHTADHVKVEIYSKDGAEIERDFELPSGRTCQVLPQKPVAWGLVKEPAPGFSLPVLGSSSTMSLADLKGKVVLLDFWASWCQPCMHSLPSTQAMFEKYKARGLVVLGINIEGDPQRAGAAAKGLGLTFPVLMAQPDDKGQYNWTSRQIADFKVHWIPYMFLIDKDGVVQSADEVKDKDVEALLGNG